MRIIFLRHGKAQDRALDIIDASRKLTKQGREILEKDLFFLAQYLDSTDFLIWTSPLARAKETAEILAAKSGQIPIRYHYFLANGDLELFQKNLQKADSDSTIVVVGHNPFFDEWVSKLTGKETQLKKGEVIDILINDIEKWEGEIIFEAKPREFGKKINEQILKNLFSSKIKVIQNNIQNFLDNPSSKSSVHKLRVSLREYKSILMLFEPLFVLSAFEIPNEKISALLNESSKLRALDVLIKRSEKHFDPIKNTELLNQMHEIRDEEKNRVRDLFATEEYAHKESEILFSQTMNALDLDQLKHLNLRTFTQKRLSSWKKDLKRKHLSLNSKEPKRFHQYRILWKQLKYSLEACPGLGLNKNTPQKAKKTKKQLGKICDADSNINLLKNFIHSNNEASIRSKETLIKKEDKRRKKIIRHLS